MARPLRLEFPGAIYHLTSRGNARHKVFFTDADRELFLKTLTAVVRRYDWVCHAYCLMANHYHLLGRRPRRTFRSACASSTAFTLKVSTGGTKALDICFRGGSRRSWLKGNPHLLELCRYIVLNPARNGETAGRIMQYESLTPLA